jgi:hypothetical protein
MRSKILATLLATTSAVALVACGGGGSSTAAASPSTTISGAVVKGPVLGALVTVTNALTGAVLGTTRTLAGGAYSLTVPFAGDVVVAVSGGNYTDESTLVLTLLTETMKTVINADGGDVTGIVTPLSTMAFNNAFPSSATSPKTAAEFKKQALALATQFQLTEAELATLPIVTGAMNPHGKVLAALSKYMQLNNVALPSLINDTFNPAKFVTVADAFTAAYNAANPGTTVTYALTGNTASIAGTGIGGGSGNCGVKAAGTLSVKGFAVPLSMDICFTGIALGSCSNSNAVLSQALGNALGKQPGLAGAANLAYSFAATCSANPSITLKLV